MTCSLVPATHKPGTCGWCGTKLKGRQTRWCSRKCSRENTKQHRWTQAKAAAKADAAWWKCARAKFIDGTTEQSDWGLSGCLGFTQEPEVNHIIPCKGKHGVWGCHHHADNLEVLCKPCHRAETNRQRANKEF